MATLKSQTSSYKLDDVQVALRRMWGGDSLSKDQERRRVNKTFLASTEDEIHEDSDAGIWWNGDDEGGDEADDDEPTENEVWFEEALIAYQEDPNDETVLANFQEAKKAFYKDARRALDRNRVNRSFYNDKGKGKGKDKTDGKGHEFKGRCMRCGKMGHKVQFCPQSGKGYKGNGKSAGVGFVDTTWAEPTARPEPEMPMYAATTEQNSKAIMDCGASSPS